MERVIFVSFIRMVQRRVYELKVLNQNITQRMLTLPAERTVEADGIYIVKLYREVPPKVNISLTELVITTSSDSINDGMGNS